MTNNISTSEYFQRQLIEMIELAKHTGTNAVEFVSTQAPEVVHQIVLWEIVNESIPVIFLLILLLVGIIVLRAGFKMAKKSGGWDGGPETVAAMAGAVAIFISIFAISVEIGDVLKPLVAPKVFLIEYTNDLLKGRR
jgi:hypothetical protein